MPMVRAQKCFLDDVLEVFGGDDARADGWRVQPGAGIARTWIFGSNTRTSVPEQGWKLHVSATNASARAVLHRTLPVLCAEAASFKLAASAQVLAHLNQGNDGPSQVGKFITVYPGDNRQAVRLALALDAATRGLPGPAIPSDRPLAPGSLVHYRYGGFRQRYAQLAGGAIVPVIRAPDGEFVRDRRELFYCPPAWAHDPFVEAGIAATLPSPSLVVGERFVLVTTLQRSPRSTLHLAADTVGGRECVLKRAHRNSLAEPDGRDACDRLRHEAGVLARLAPDPRFPEIYGLVERDDELFLAMEDIPGETLSCRVATIALRGQFIPQAQLVRWGRDAAAALATIHVNGLVYRDLKSANIIVTPEGSLRLVDFELAHDLDNPLAPSPGGTSGYMSPQAEAGGPPSVADDVYGLGALLYFLATNAEPSLAPRRRPLLDRPPELIHPALDEALVNVIARCLDPEPSRRYPSLAVVEADLAELDAHSCGPVPVMEDSQPSQPERNPHLRYRLKARQIGDTLCAVAERTPESGELCWRSTHQYGNGLFARDLNTGGAGVVLALAEIAGEFGDETHRAVAAEGARGLLTLPRFEGPPLPGLYVGEAGVAAALLRAGQVLRDPELISLASDCGRWISNLPYMSPDLFNGTAGRVRVHLWLWDEIGDPEPLRHAIAAGEALLAAAETNDAGECRWRIPAGYGGLSGRSYVGYAHGAAGIADALLDLFEATGDERFRQRATAAGHWLARLATPVLDDQSGLDWPTTEGGGLFGPFWCHGAAGVGRFFLHAARLAILPNASDLALGAARAAARGARWAGPTQCHGLAGNIEFLLDVFQATGDQTYLQEAESLAHLLAAFAAEQDGRLVWSSEWPNVFTPDYLVGYAGVAMCLLRLSDPSRLPCQLDRRGFRHGNEHNGTDH